MEAASERWSPWYTLALGWIFIGKLSRGRAWESGKRSAAGQLGSWSVGDGRKPLKMEKKE
jgi:hypothetical protein